MARTFEVVPREEYHESVKQMKATPWDPRVRNQRASGKVGTISMQKVDDVIDELCGKSVEVCHIEPLEVPIKMLLVATHTRLCYSLKVKDRNWGLTVERPATTAVG